MQRAVIFGGDDPAGRNIADKLSGKGVAARRVDERILFLESLDLRAEVCVVASRHRSDSGVPVLTTHAPGNFGAAEHGGRPRELGIAPALFLHEALRALRDESESRGLGLPVCLEATHHGPTSLESPILFVEVGSEERMWDNMEACEAAAEAIKTVLASEPEGLPSALGFGGGHYCRKFSEIEEYALGHICPKHSLANLDREMVEEMAEKTVPRPHAALVEKKGLGEEKKRVIALLEDAGLELVRV